MYGCSKDVWFSFHLGCHSQLFHSQPSVFLLWLRQLPWCGDRTPASVPQPAEGRSSPTNTPAFPPSSFILPSFAWFYIFFSTGQVALFALSWCSACVLCLMVHSWCIREERCTPRPPTPLPSCSPPPFFLLNIFTSHLCSKPSWTYTSLYKNELN